MTTHSITADPLLDPLLLTPFTLHTRTSPPSQPVLLKLRLTPDPHLSPASPALTVVTGTLRTVHYQLLLLRGLTKLAKAALSAAGLSVAASRRALALEQGMISDPALAVAVARRCVEEVEAGTASVESVVDEFGQHTLALTSCSLGITLDFFLEAVPAVNAFAALERHLFTPYFAVRDAFNSIEHSSHDKPGSTEQPATIEQRVLQSAMRHKEGVCDYGALGDSRVTRAMVRWSALAYALIDENDTNLPPIGSTSDTTAAAPRRSPSPQPGSITDTLEQSSDDPIEHSQPVLVFPPRRSGRNKLSLGGSEIAKRILDHKAALHGERISFDETQQPSIPPSPRKKRKADTASESAGDSGPPRKRVLVVDSDEGDEVVSVEVPAGGCGCEDEAEDAEPSTDEDVGNAHEQLEDGEEPSTDDDVSPPPPAHSPALTRVAADDRSDSPSEPSTFSPVKPAPAPRPQQQQERHLPQPSLDRSLPTFSRPAMASLARSAPAAPIAASPPAPARRASAEVAEQDAARRKATRDRMARARRR